MMSRALQEARERGSVPPGREKAALGRLRGGRPLAPELERAFTRLLREAGIWARSGADPAIHEFRRHLRRARALVRCLRPVGESELLQTVDASLQGASRQVAALRDLEALSETAERLGLKKLAGPAGKAIRGELAAALSATRRDRDAALAAAYKSLKGLPAAFARSVPPSVEAADLAPGIVATYRAARRAHRRAGSDDESLHRWRRRTKDLSHQLEAIELLEGYRLPLRPAKLEKLSDALGILRDCEALRAELKSRELLRGKPGKRIDATLEGLIANARIAAGERGKKLFRKSPKKFAAALLR